MVYLIVDSTSDTTEPIACYLDKEEAYDSLKYFCSIHPFGWLEVISEDEYRTLFG